MKIKKKLFMVAYVAGIIIALGLLNFVVTTIKKNPATPISAEELADTAIAQYTERANSTTTTTEARIPFFLSPFASARAQTLVDGCSLRLSFAPLQKAVKSGDTIDYAITFSNQGKEECKNVSLSVYYKDKEHFVRSTPSPTASDYYWSIGDLGSSKNSTISLTTRTDYANGEDMISEACASADNSPDICSQNVIFVESTALKNDTLSKPISIPSYLGSVWGKVFNKKEFGIWVWDSPLVMSSAYAQEVITTSKKNGFNVIYVTIDDYIPITSIRDTDDRNQQKADYMKRLSVFVAGAKSAGIEVDAVGGAKDWAISKNRWKGYALIEFVKEYNSTYPNAPLRALQYDVEPYLLSDYETNKQEILTEFVEFVDESAKRLADSSIGLSIVVPHFYDSDQKWTPQVNYNGEKAHTFTQLLKVLSQKDDTSIIIMSYRNFFDRENGSRQISEKEIKEATEGGYNTKIIIAQETGNVSPEYVTFYDYPKISLFDALSEIQVYFGKYKNFGGVSVHYFDSFLKLD